MRIFILLISVFSVVACVEEENAQKVIDAAMKAHGTDLLENARVNFDFRDKSYSLDRVKGSLEFSRTFIDDSLGRIRDILKNYSEFERQVNDSTVQISEELKKKYSSSINSVLYFFQLPFNLKDSAVNLHYLDKNIVSGQMYHKIKVTFDAEGGGDDHDDIFVYWIHTKNYTIDFFGYSYQVNGGGIRFRQAVNRRKKEGVVFQNYINFKSLDKSIPVEDLDEFYETGQLEKLSVIANENIQVSLQ